MSSTGSEWVFKDGVEYIWFIGIPYSGLSVCDHSEFGTLIHWVSIIYVCLGVVWLRRKTILPADVLYFWQAIQCKWYCWRGWTKLVRRV